MKRGEGRNKNMIYKTWTSDFYQLEEAAQKKVSRARDHLVY